MARRKRRSPPPFPLMLAELSLASWETILRRSRMMADGTCSPAEYRRMVREKGEAAVRSMLLLGRGGAAAAGALAPWHSLAAANAKRLRRRRR